jgi:oxalate decarboxylase
MTGSPHTFAFEKFPPQFVSDCGTWKSVNQSVFSLFRGHARMTLLSPGGKVDTYTLGPGDMYFIPKAFPHHIENLNDDEVRFLIFFDQTMPEDIGFTGGLAAFPSRIIALTLGCTRETLPKIPAYPSDLLLVGKVNPVEP